jgi:hypothetical protein
MFKYNVYFNTSDNLRTCCTNALTKVESDTEATALYIDVTGPHCIDVCNGKTIHPDKGVETEITVTAKIKGVMANHRISEFWCGPYFAKDLASLPDDTQLLMIELDDGSFICVVPVVNNTYKSVIVGKDENTFNSKTNLMLAMCGTCMTFDEFKKYLTNEKLFNVIKFDNWEGIE